MTSDVHSLKAPVDTLKNPPVWRLRGEAIGPKALEGNVGLIAMTRSQPQDKMRGGQPMRMLDARVSVSRPDRRLGCEVLSAEC